MLTSLTAAGQKRVKYKNLYPLLESREYQTAYPLLQRYIIDNDDEANPHFYMGEIIAQQLDSIPIFPSVDAYDSLANKAIYHYKKAIQYVDDKEIRKNDEYYIAYNRRDLRTGKFGIKVSDVHLDYENKIKDLNKAINTAKNLNSDREKFQETYQQIKKKIQSYAETYSTAEELLFNTDEELQRSLEDLITDYTVFYSDVKTHYKKLSDFNPQLYAVNYEIKDVNSWNQLYNLEFNWEEPLLKTYGDYFENILSDYRVEIKPLKQKIDSLTKNAFEKIQLSESATYKSEIGTIEESENIEELLKKYDQDLLPIQMLEYLKLKNKSTIYENENLYPVITDTSNIYGKSIYFDSLLSIYNSMNEKLDHLNTIKLKRYKGFYNSYFSLFDPSLESFLAVENTINEKKINTTTDLLNQYDSLSKIITIGEDNYTIVNDNPNSLMITTVDSMLYAAYQKEKELLLLKINYGMKVENMISIDSVFSNVSMNAGDDQLLFALSRQKEIQLDSINLPVDSMAIETDSTVNQSADTAQIDKIRYETVLVLVDVQSFTIAWKQQFQKALAVNRFKEEAGIFFIYNDAGEVIATLTAEGKVIR